MDKIKPRKNDKSHLDLITFVEDRPGHDFRYSTDITKIRNTLGWSPRFTFDQAIIETIEWYKSL